MSLEVLYMEKKTLTELILALEQELLRLGYTNGSMTFYKSRWQMLLTFAQERDESYFSERLGARPRDPK